MEIINLALSAAPPRPYALAMGVTFNLNPEEHIVAIGHPIDFKGMQVSACVQVLTKVNSSCALERATS